MKRILIVEDEKDIVEVLRANLEVEGFAVESVGDGAVGLARIEKSPPDLLILDLMLPGLPGLEVCKRIRSEPRLQRLPILMLSARGQEADRIVGLELGGDDYVTKPFSPQELVARVKALLRRAEPSEEHEAPLAIGELVIDPSSYRFTRAGKPVPLTTMEFRLLYFLASRPNKVYSRDQLLDAVWGPGTFLMPRIIDVYVRRLRQKIEPDSENPTYLKTIRGAGYMFGTT